MIATLNVLGLDYATLGNHEFDLQEGSLRRRLNESQFEWIASNVYEYNSTKPFHNVLPYKIIIILNIKILLIGLTISDNVGPPPSAPYVTITSQQTLPRFTADFIKHLREDLNLKWDVLICLTHLNMQNDIEVVEHNLNIDVIMGGHEHENYYLKRGSKHTPIYKADDNAFSVFIHRFAYQPQTKQLLIFSQLTQVSPRFQDEPKTAEVANYFYQTGLQAYREKGNGKFSILIHIRELTYLFFIGYVPERVVCVLPPGLYLDGRSAVIRSQQTHLTRALCRAMMDETNTTVCVLNAGAIRLDDQLMGTITQYDILRCLPFPTNIISLRVNGLTLVKALNRGLMNINTGMFISYAGLEYDALVEKWFLQPNRQPLDNESLILTIVSIPYFITNTELKHASENLTTYKTLTVAFIEYLEKIYAKTTHRSSS
jgi:5'-nucleotidase